MAGLPAAGYKAFSVGHCGCSTYSATGTLAVAEGQVAASPLTKITAIRSNGRTTCTRLSYTGSGATMIGSVGLLVPNRTSRPPGSEPFWRYYFQGPLW